VTLGVVIFNFGAPVKAGKGGGEAPLTLLGIAIVAGTSQGFSLLRPNFFRDSHSRTPPFIAQCIYSIVYFVPALTGT